MQFCATLCSSVNPSLPLLAADNLLYDRHAMSTANLLQSEYGWRLTGAFNETHLAVLLLAAQDLSAFAEAQAPGSGQIWMRRWLAPVHFYRGGRPQWVVSRVAAHATSVVFPRRDVWLNKNFLILPNPRHHIVHELAHVLDNRLGPKALPAAIFWRWARGPLGARNGRRCAWDTLFKWCLRHPAGQPVGGVGWRRLRQSRQR